MGPHTSISTAHTYPDTHPYVPHTHTYTHPTYGTHITQTHTSNVRHTNYPHTCIQRTAHTRPTHIHTYDCTHIPITAISRIGVSLRPSPVGDRWRIGHTPLGPNNWAQMMPSFANNPIGFRAVAFFPIGQVTTEELITAAATANELPDAHAHIKSSSGRTRRFFLEIATTESSFYRLSRKIQ